MITIEFLRGFRFGGYALFDLTVSFLGMYILSPLLSKLFLKVNIIIPKKNWVFLTLPIGIIAHLLVNNITLMTKNVLDLHGHFWIKLFIVLCIIFGITGIKRKKNK